MPVIASLGREDLELKAAQRIQRWWRSTRARRAFRGVVALLRRCEKASTLDLLRSFLPDEYKFLSNAALPAARLRLRLSGLAYPPVIMYKLFTVGTSCYLRPNITQPCGGFEQRIADDAAVTDGGRHNVWRVLTSARGHGFYGFNDNLAVLQQQQQQHSAKEGGGESKGRGSKQKKKAPARRQTKALQAYTWHSADSRESLSRGIARNQRSVRRYDLQKGWVTEIAATQQHL